METFFALLALCAGNLPVTGEFPTQMPVTRSFDAFFDMHPNKRFSKQSGRQWFETPSRSIWRHCNVRNQESGFTFCLRQIAVQVDEIPGETFTNMDYIKYGTKLRIHSPTLYNGLIAYLCLY